MEEKIDLRRIALDEKKMEWKMVKKGCLGLISGILLVAAWIWYVSIGGTLSAHVYAMIAVSGVSVVIWGLYIVNSIKIIKRANKYLEEWEE